MQERLFEERTATSGPQFHKVLQQRSNKVLHYSIGSSVSVRRLT